MNLVTLENVSKQYSERVLLDNVSLQINSGDKIGLIGLNGSGKTTLLQMIAGLEPPDKGQVTVFGGGRVQYLPQEPVLNDSLTVLEQLFDSDSPQVRLLRDYEWAAEQLHERPDDAEWQHRLTVLSDELSRTDAWGAEAKVKGMLTQLGITDFARPIAALSGGQRKRVALARALIDQADLLILDEPTNHVDAEMIDWLEGHLASEPKALLMVTHDRYFLNRVVNRIIELDRRQLVSYPGSYTHYLELSTARHEQLVAAEEAHQNTLRRELEWLRRGAQARSTKQKARQQRVAELQKLSYDSRSNQVMINLAGRRLGRQVLMVQQLSKSFNGLQVFQELNFELKPGDRIGIVGPNGVGKSTFLNILAQRIEPDNGTVTWGETVVWGYYDQQSSLLDESLRVIEFIEQMAPLIITKDGTRMSAFQVLEWFLFTRPQQYAYISSLSGGEKRRLYLLYILMQQPNVLLLDEPTNDLDIQTLAVLEEFLDHFQGSLVVVSHDRYFLDRTVDFLVSFEQGRVSQRYPAPYSTYQELRAAEVKAITPPTAPKLVPIKSKPTSRKLSYREQQELATLETRLSELESRKSQLQSNINANGSNYVKLSALVVELETIEIELEPVMERWLELSELAEG